ncbi:hypothetical protein [Thermocatellispora tengchongensis]|uniref:hypothetical protein n=1 Tax=Thermocatellispora tengchongensis TaxID=1073253 RepID=UPI003635CE7D
MAGPVVAYAQDLPAHDAPAQPQVGGVAHAAGELQAQLGEVALDPADGGQDARQQRRDLALALVGGKFLDQEGAVAERLEVV